MGLIREAFRRVSMARVANVPHPISPDPWRIAMLPRERDYMRDVGDGSGSNLVQPAMEFIGHGFIEAPVRVREKRGEDLVAVEQGMPEILRRPNRYYSGALLWLPTVANWIGDGNAYWIITAFSAGNRPAEIVWAPSWLVEPKGPDDGSELITHYEYRPNGRNIRLDPDQLVHFRWGLDPQNPRKGHSPLKYVLREIYSDEEAARFTATLLRNMGVPGMLVSPKGDLAMTPAEAQEAKTDIIQKTTGDRRGEPLVMTVATDVQEWGFSPEQLDLSRLRAIPESRVAAAVGIPAAVLGFLAGMEQTKVGATMAELRELAYEQGVIPKMRLFSEELHTQLLPHYTDDTDRFVVDFDTSAVRVLQEDQNKMAERWKTLVSSGIAKRSEARGAFGLPVEPGDDVYHLPISVTEIGPDAMPREEPARIAASRGYVMEKKATRQQLAYLRQVERAGQGVSQRFAADLQRAFDDLGARATAAWEAIPQRFVADPLDEPTVEAILAALSLEDWRTIVLRPLWDRHYIRMSELTYEALRLNIGIDLGTNLPDPVARQVIAAGGRNLGLVDLDAATRHALFEALAASREAGLGPIEAARLIRRYIGAGRFTGMEAERAGSGVRYRSELIARTETLHAQRMSVAEAGSAAGFTRYLAFDNRTGFGDAECVARDGQVFTYDEMLAESASEHPNGTLSFAPVPESQVRQGRVTKVTHVEYDADNGRLARTWEEEVANG